MRGFCIVPTLINYTFSNFQKMWLKVTIEFVPQTFKGLKMIMNGNEVPVANTTTNQTLGVEVELSVLRRPANSKRTTTVVYDEDMPVYSITPGMRPNDKQHILQEFDSENED